jgi:dTDP-4-dehydrorhamnose reductase
MKILVFGATGLLGTVLCQKLGEAGHAVTGFRRSEAAPCTTESEIGDAFAQAIDQAAPECVINLIAATNVDECQRNMAHAALLNCFVPQVLSNICGRKAHLLHVSSDQVYGGDGPHDETRTSPVNAYGLTKAVGEYPVLLAGGCVLRTNFFGLSRTPGRASLSDWLISAGRAGRAVDVFDDVLFSPVGMTTVSAAIRKAAEAQLVGLFNVGAADWLSKADFARLFFEQLGLDQSLLKPRSVYMASLEAPRPLDMRMVSGRFRRLTGFELPTVQREIEYEAAAYTRSKF